MSNKFITLASIYLKKDFSEKISEEQRGFLEEALGNVSIIVDNYHVKSLEVNGLTPTINDKGKTYLNAQSQVAKYERIVGAGKMEEEDAKANLAKDDEFGKLGEITIVCEE